MCACAGLDTDQDLFVSLSIPSAVAIGRANAHSRGGEVETKARSVRLEGQKVLVERECVKILPL